MTIAQTTTTSFRVELFEAVHDFTTDTFKIALYTGAADIGPGTTAYTSTGETSGTGYTAGGNTLTVTTLPTSGNNTYDVPTAYVSFGNTSWSGASFTARGALIYNASKSNKSVAVLDFGADKTVSGNTFTVQFPAADPNSAIVRIS
jgi:hypothetical protein